MGTAIGFALVQPAFDSFLIFTALGAGHGAPYLCWHACPSCCACCRGRARGWNRFGRPWRSRCCATVAWLVWVFGQQTGNDGVLSLLLALLSGSMGAWITGRFDSAHRHPIGVLTIGLCLGTATFLVVSASSPTGVSAPHVAAADDGSGVRWLPWDPDAVARHRDEGARRVRRLHRRLVPLVQM
jgi:thiol:disulfide interchange protein DsbD